MLLSIQRGIGSWAIALGVLGVSSLSVGCAGETVDTADTADPAEDGSKTIASGYEELCTPSGGSELTFADEQDATEKLAGRWVLCSGPGLPMATEQPHQAGIELTTDLQWYMLVASGSDLVRADGFQASDTFRFQPPQELQQGPSTTALLFMGIDYSFVDVSMLDSPRKTRWVYDSLGGGDSIYAFIEP